MITWTNKGKDYWESYEYSTEKSVSIRAYVNGRYMILKNGQIAFSGKANNKEKAIEALEKYLSPISGAVDTKNTLEEFTDELVVQKEIIQTTEDTPIIENTTSYELRFSAVESPVESNSVVVSFEPKEDTIVKYTTNGKEVISSSKIYRGEFTVEKGTPINYTVFDLDKNILCKGTFIGEEGGSDGNYV